MSVCNEREEQRKREGKFLENKKCMKVNFMCVGWYTSRTFPSHIFKYWLLFSALIVIFFPSNCGMKQLFWRLQLRNFICWVVFILLLLNLQVREFFLKVERQFERPRSAGEIWSDKHTPRLRAVKNLVTLPVSQWPTRKHTDCNTCWPKTSW